MMMSQPIFLCCFVVRVVVGNIVVVVFIFVAVLIGVCYGQEKFN